MTAPTNGDSAGPYRVVSSDLFRQQVLASLADAVQAGTAQEFRTALRRIWDRLRSDPWNFGEAKYRLPALKLQVRQGAIRPVIVYYAVHEDWSIVFVRGFRVLS